MSDTPLTDEQVLAYITEDGSELVHASAARELETELAAMLARAEKAEADTARIDWLEENMDYIGGGSGGTYTFFTPADVECGMLRDAIDAAMKEAIK